jgi:hypothetical protein
VPSPLEPGLGTAQPKPNVRKTLDTTTDLGGLMKPKAPKQLVFECVCECRPRRIL